MRASLNPNVTISGTGSYMPPLVVTNDDLSKRVHGYDEAHSGPFGAWVDQVTHIHQRHVSAPETRSHDLALVAARRALEAAALEPKDIDFIIYASFTMSQMIPGDHCVFAQELGASSCPVFQLVAACAGSIYGLSLAYAMITAGMHDNILVVGSETISKVLNYNDPITSIIFGDGAGAAIVSRRSAPTEGGGMLEPKLNFSYSPRNITLANSNVPMDVGRFPDRQTQPGVPLVEQALVEMESGPNVLRTAVTQMAGCTLEALGYERRALRKGAEGLAETLADARIIPHQANGRIIDGLADKLHVPREHVTRTIYRYGNTSAASNLVALDFAAREGSMQRVLDDEGLVTEIVTDADQRIRPGQLVLLPSIGGGYLMGCAGFIAEPSLCEQGQIPEEHALEGAHA